MANETLTPEATLRAVEGEMARQDTVYGAFSSDAPSVRLAVACLEDEVRECWGAWDAGKRRPDWYALREEALQVAAVALRLARDVEVADVD